MLSEVRVARIVEAIGRHRGGALSCMEAAEALGMSERHFRRLRERYEAEGAEGLIDRRRGRASGRRAPVERIEWVLDQYRTRYWDFTAKHFHERVVAEHKFELGYTWTKRVLQDAGLVRRAPKRSAHRKKRPRRPLPGMMLFQDGSRHPWLADRPTEVGRALKQLGIAHIPSYSPEARGRMERAFGTLQQRLPQELRLAGITTVEAADRFLAERFIPAHNRRFAVAAAEPGSAFVPFAGVLAEILCVQAERVVGHDNCVRYAGLSLQIPEQAHRHHFVRVTVRVHEYADGSLAVFHGPRCLARYDAAGCLSAEEQGRSAA